MSTFNRATYRALCDATRARHQCTPARTTFACSVCPATLVCDVPLKRRLVLFGVDEGATSDSLPDKNAHS